MNILITGAGSYVGTSVERWIKNHSNYRVDTLDMLKDTWRDTDFSIYDVVYHVAGIAHVNAKANMEALYYKVNRDLTIEVAQKAKVFRSRLPRLSNRPVRSWKHKQWKTKS